MWFLNVIFEGKKKNQILENGIDKIWHIATLLFVITPPMIE